MTVVLHTPESGVVKTDISDGWTVIEGAPTMTTWFEYQSPDKSIVTGTWRSTTGAYRAEARFHEYVYLVEGVIELTPDGGETVTARAGDAFTVEADFKGVWRIVEPVYKRFLLKMG